MTNANPDAGRGTVPALGAYFIIPLLAVSLPVVSFFMSSALATPTLIINVAERAIAASLLLHRIIETSPCR